MSNLKQPPMCCCLLPRAGIMLFTFLYAGYAFSGMFFVSLGYIFIEKFAPAMVVEDGLFSLLLTWGRIADALCGSIYCYAFILAYKRKWKHFRPVLHALLVIAIYGIYSMYTAIQSISTLKFTLHDANIDHLHEDDIARMETSFTVFSVGSILIGHVIPWVIQVCLIKQTRSYIQYVLYKKEEKRISSFSEQHTTKKL